MGTLTSFTSRRVNITYVTDDGCTSVDSAGMLFVRPITARSSYITWKDLPIYDATEVFYVQKSTSPIDGWVTIAKRTIMDTGFLDENANNSMNRHHIEYYRILAPTSSYVFGVANVEGTIDPYGSEIARRHRILLSKGRNGNLTHVFIKTRNGERCPRCWDEILQERVTIDCRECNDTGFIVGYHNPIPTHISFGPETVAVQVDVDGPSPAPNDVSAWTSNFPLLNIGDIIVEEKGYRFWEVKQVNLTMHKRVVTRQELVLAKCEGDDPLLRLIYRIPKEGSYGQGVFEDDTPYSEGVYDSLPTEVFFEPPGVPMEP